MATLAERLEAPVLTPAAAKAAQIADLARRADKALEIAGVALEDEDYGKYRRAITRYHLRVIQHQYVWDQPDGAICPRCTYGETGWSQAAVQRGEVWESCLDHIQDIHERRAAEYAERDCEDLDG